MWIHTEKEHKAGKKFSGCIKKEKYASVFGLIEVEISQFDLYPPSPPPGTLLNLKSSDESLFTSSSPDTFFILSNISVSLWTEVKLFRGKK